MSQERNKDLSPQSGCREKRKMTITYLWQLSRRWIAPDQCQGIVDRLTYYTVDVCFKQQWQLSWILRVFIIYIYPSNMVFDTVSSMAQIGKGLLSPDPSTRSVYVGCCIRYPYVLHKCLLYLRVRLTGASVICGPYRFRKLKPLRCTDRTISYTWNRTWRAL